MVFRWYGETKFLYHEKIHVWPFDHRIIGGL